MNTTQTKKKLVPFWWAIWIVFLLLVFGVPTLAARLMALPGDPVHQALLSGQSVTADDMATLETTRTRLVSWFASNEYYNDLALASLNKAIAATKPEESTALYKESLDWQTKALHETPADAYGWYRFAYLTYMMEGGAKPRVAQAWRQSVASAPFEPRLQLPRLQMAMSLGDLLDAGDRHQIERHIRYVWYDDPDHLAKLAYEGRYVSFAEDALRSDEESLKEFRFKINSK